MLLRSTRFASFRALGAHLAIPLKLVAITSALPVHAKLPLKAISHYISFARAVEAVFEKLFMP